MMWSDGDEDRRRRLREIRAVRQHAEEPRRRWFACDSTDLFVWQDADGRPLAFELCYDKPHDEHALRFRREAGFVHTRIDDGEASPLKNATPITVPDGQFDLTEIALKFELVAARIDPAVYRFVLGALHADR
jgi:hypothetical protein